MSSIYGNASRSFHIECFGSRKKEDGSLYKLCDLFSISWHHACKLIETYLQSLQKPYQSLHKLMEWACTGWKLLWGCNFLSLQKPYVTKLAQADGMGLHRLKAAVELQFLKLTEAICTKAYTSWWNGPTQAESCSGAANFYFWHDNGEGVKAVNWPFFPCV